MFVGGGSLVIEGNEHYPGVGHNSVYSFNGMDYLVFHAYDAEDEGRPVLRILQLSWDEEKWPIPLINSELPCVIRK
jgi:arabinan endo-1,5-alpha-L-arabinosidase